MKAKEAAEDENEKDDDDTQEDGFYGAGRDINAF